MKISSVLAMTSCLMISTIIFLNSGISLAESRSKNETIENKGTESDSAQKEVVKVTSTGLEPLTLKLTKLDGSVFFVNSTRDSLVTIDVNFGEKKPHCASSNMKFNPDGHMRSAQPIGPKDFALMCFPDKGEYAVNVFGVLPKGKPMIGSVIVE